MGTKKIHWFALKFLLIGSCVFALSAEVFAAGVSLSATPASQSVTVGQTASYTIKINRDNYTDKVTLSATGLPAGVTATFSANGTTATSTTLKLQTQTTTPIGTFSITVKGTATGISIAPIVVKLTTLPVPAISLTVSPEEQSIIAGQTTYYDIRINRTGFSGPVILSAENVPTGVSVVFEPQETSGNTSRMWIYSNGLQSFAQSFGMNVVARRSGFDVPKTAKPLKLNVNCGIVWNYQGHLEFDGHADVATTVTSDNFGNIYAAGHVVRNGETELWIAKYSSSNGAKIWLQNVTLQNVVGLGKIARAIAVDNSGGTIYLAGSTETAPNANFDAFIVRFDSNGNQISNYVFGDPFNEDGSGGMSLGFDANGRPVLTAVMHVDRTDVGNNFSYAFYNISRMIIDSSGGVFSNPADALVRQRDGDPNDLAVGSDGSVYVVGGELFDSPTNPHFYGFVQKFNASGNHVFNIPLAQNVIPTRVAVDSAGNIFIAGTQNRQPMGGSFSQDVWITKLDSSGNHLWTNFETSSGTEEIGDLITDANGNLIYSGSTTGSLTANNIDSKPDAWLAKRSPAGVLFFMRQFAVADTDSFDAIALDGAGNALLAGTTVNFINDNFGFEDILLVKYSLNSGVGFFPPSVTGLSPASVRSGTQFRIQGANFYGVSGVYFDGQPLQVVAVSPSEITVVAPVVTMSRTANLTVSLSCLQLNSPVQLTVTP